MVIGIVRLPIVMAIFCLNVQTRIIIKIPTYNDNNMFRSRDLPLNFVIILDQTVEMADTDYMSQCSTLV